MSINKFFIGCFYKSILGIFIIIFAILCSCKREELYKKGLDRIVLFDPQEKKEQLIITDQDNTKNDPVMFWDMKILKNVYKFEQMKQSKKRIHKYLLDPITLEPIEVPSDKMNDF